MKRIIKLLAAIFITMTFLTGCGFMGKTLNPYEDQFSCPEGDTGKCQSIQKAYDESLGITTQPAQPNQPGSQPNNIITQYYDEKPKTDAQQVYERERYERLAGLIQDEKPPIVVPPEVVRVLILSYTSSENEMFGFRYAYFFASEPTWMLSTGNEGRY